MKGFILALQRGRLVSYVLATLVLLAAIVLFFLQQLPVALYKLALVSVTTSIGYHLEHALYPYQY